MGIKEIYHSKFRWLGVALMILPLLSSCIREEEFNNSPQGNFEALWKIIDEQYCFLDYKQIDWDAIHDKYQPLITSNMGNDGLFQLLDSMLAELKDGHVNLYSSSNVARYWDWYLDYPRNFNEGIIERQYLGKTYRIAAGMKYKILDDNIGYIYYESFSSGVGNGNLDEVLSYLAPCSGLILDVRNNGGGNLTNSERIAARFTNEKVLTGYIQHKTGKGHSDFSDPKPIYLEPSNSIRWQKPVMLLINRHSYSATNDFVNAMRYFPNVTLVGDKTGGGSGLPFSSELPNGWGVRFSASPHLDADKQHIEFGIDPDRMLDVIMGGAVGGIVGARSYYVLLKWDYYGQNLDQIFNTRSGGMAIYGGIIGGLLIGLLMCKIRKVRFVPAVDLAAGGFFIGQAIGRWGNFVNIEAFGGNTSLPWGMSSSVITSYLTEHEAESALQTIIEEKTGLSYTPEWDAVIKGIVDNSHTL